MTTTSTWHAGLLSHGTTYHDVTHAINKQAFKSSHELRHVSMKNLVFVKVMDKDRKITSSRNHCTVSKFHINVSVIFVQLRCIEKMWTSSASE